MDCGDLNLEVVGVFVLFVYSLIRGFVDSLLRGVISGYGSLGFSLMVCKRVGLALPLISVLRRLTDIRGEDAQQDVESLLPRCGCRSHNGVLGEPTGPILISSVW